MTIFRACAASTATLLTIIMLLIAAPAGAQAQTKTGAWAPVDCATFKLDEVAPERGVACGYVTVPLRHATPDGPTIQLATVIIPSTAPDRQPDSLFMAQGGPGGSTIETYARY